MFSSFLGHMSSMTFVVINCMPYVPCMHSVTVDTILRLKHPASMLFIVSCGFAQGMIAIECMHRFEDAAYYNWLMAASHKNHATEISDGKPPSPIP